MQTASFHFPFSSVWAALFCCALISAATRMPAQPVYPSGHPQQAGAADLREQLERLRVLGSALYVAAHPDDENTRLIAWLAGERKVTTTYLSLTRGDGGQNLIGPELSELLGVLRTQELLRARGVDRGEQMFTRANDFGYSKHPDETLAIWDRDEVLGDMVWSIRKTRPDIIVNRFNHLTPGSTHGHHTASAVLALEAFNLAADPQAYPEQLTQVEPWQASRFFFNTSWWFYGSQEAFQKADKSGLIAVDPGTYNPMRGLSYTEVAARSRSMHRCQGFGSTGSRGSDLDYLEFLQGVPMPQPSASSAPAAADADASRSVAQGDPFAGLDITWQRLNGGSAIDAALLKASAAFRPEKPEAAVPALLEAWRLMEPLEDDPRVARKRIEAADLIRQCLGLWAEAVANVALASPGDSLRVQLELVLRRPAVLSVESLQITDARQRSVHRLGELPFALADNAAFKKSIALKVPDDLSFSTAYWLQEPGTLGLFQVSDQLLRGLPESPRPLRVTAVINIDGALLPLHFPVVYKENDPERGEVYQAFELVPPAVIKAERPVFLFSGSGPGTVKLSVRANRDQVGGRVLVRWPEGWSASGDPAFQLAEKGQETIVEFQVLPPAGNQTADLFLALEIEGKRYPFSQEMVAYEHIPTQILLRPAMTRLAKLDLAIHSKNIGYIMGAGDEIPEALRDIGCTVTLLEDADLRPD
ncbi:MAG: LmbE family protein, partial [Bacteroidetes bacterium]|nr:LmbE family protein [Bacteroidota bacterium]